MTHNKGTNEKKGIEKTEKKTMNKKRTHEIIAHTKKR